MSEYQMVVELTDGLQILRHYSEAASADPQMSVMVAKEYLFVYDAAPLPDLVAAALRDLSWEGPLPDGTWRVYVGGK